VPPRALDNVEECGIAEERSEYLVASRIEPLHQRQALFQQVHRFLALTEPGVIMRQQKKDRSTVYQPRQHFFD